jgi:hypothetical protein
MMQFIHMTDEQLRRQLVEQYMQHLNVTPASEAIQAMKSELYQRGHERTDVITLALEALLRLQNQKN